NRSFTWAFTESIAVQERDKAATQGDLTLPYSNGLLEGHTNRLKLIKRGMYGRANFDLLRLRVPCASCITKPDGEPRFDSREHENAGILCHPGPIFDSAVADNFCHKIGK